MHLMIVEDEQFIREGICMLLQELKEITQIDTARDGTEAWEKILASEQFPDILISDIRMPGMDGLSLSEKIRNHSRVTKVIFISGYEDFSYAKKAIYLGASGYITKPIDQQELLELAEKVIHQIQLEDQQHRRQELEYFHQETPDGFIREILDQIRQSPGEISLKSLAKKWCCSPAYLSLLFKEQTGYNFKDYLLDCKMKMGKELLTQNTDSEELCRILGYSDYDYFSKIFRKYYGESPSEYKKRHNI